MGSDTELFKAERSMGILIYRTFIILFLSAATALGAWNLSETHNTSVMIRGLSEQHTADREEISRIAKAQLELYNMIEKMKDRESKLDTRVSIIETEIKKP